MQKLLQHFAAYSRRMRTCGGSCGPSSRTKKDPGLYRCQHGIKPSLCAISPLQFNDSPFASCSRKCSRFTSTHIVCCSRRLRLEWCWISRLKNPNSKHWQAGFGRSRAGQLLRSFYLYSYKKCFDVRKVSYPHWWVKLRTDCICEQYDWSYINWTAMWVKHTHSVGQGNHMIGKLPVWKCFPSTLKRKAVWCGWGLTKPKEKGICMHSCLQKCTFIALFSATKYYTEDLFTDVTQYQQLFFFFMQLKDQLCSSIYLAKFSKCAKCHE